MSRLADYNESEVLTFNSLLALLSRRSRQSIYNLMRRDPSFPRPRPIGTTNTATYTKSNLGHHQLQLALWRCRT
jgi:predicted DNA-binding transcriptional regulator AlpA